jgi:hypothetical protein
VTKAEISALVTILAACYPNARLQPGNVLAYENFLAGLDHERAQKAIGVVVRSCKFMPSIAEICAAYEGISSGPRSDEPPYHQTFTPRLPSGPCMKPHELSEAISAFLQKGKRGQS